MTCCEGNGLVFVALANGYLLEQDILDEELARKEAEIKKRNKVITDNIEKEVSEINDLNKVVKTQTEQLNDDTSNLNSKIVELKKLGEKALSKDNGLSLLEYRNLLDCDSKNGLQNEAICRDPHNPTDLVNNDWIERGYSETNTDQFRDDNISSATDISKPINNQVSISSSSNTDSLSDSASEGTTIDRTEHDSKVGGNSKDDVISYLFTE